MPKEVVYGNLITPTTSTADRTLTFVYGPEHQRIKQTVQLSGTGTSSYTAGTTWTAHGIDSLGLSYEKAILANGVTENKHYVSAQGVVFALHVSRSGTLGTLTTTTTSYLHQDQQGSVTTVTDKTGVVAERMAYDPWGKRRQVNGNPDVLDSIVGAKTDRGYTMQEHLDEIGVIHMNAQVYDPLIGRFMSADSVIPNPFDMKAFNRYSYGANNPLKYNDPTGHFYDEGSGGGGANEAGGGSSCITCNWVTVYQDPGDAGTGDRPASGGGGGPNKYDPGSNFWGSKSGDSNGINLPSVVIIAAPVGAGGNGNDDLAAASSGLQGAQDGVDSVGPIADAGTIEIAGPDTHTMGAPATPQASIDVQQDQLKLVQSVVANYVDRMNDVCGECSRETFLKMQLEVSPGTAAERGLPAGTMATYDAKTNTATFYQEYFTSPAANPVTQAGVMFHEYVHSTPSNQALFENGTPSDHKQDYPLRPWETPAIRNESVLIDRYGSEIWMLLRK